jgi:4-oxalocrotonate tautomerase
MPLINVKFPRGTLSPRKKQEIIRKVTDTIVAIEGEAFRAVTWVYVEEITSRDWAGKPIVLPAPDPPRSQNTTDRQWPKTSPVPAVGTDRPLPGRLSDGGVCRTSFPQTPCSKGVLVCR